MKILICTNHRTGGYRETSFVPSAGFNGIQFLFTHEGYIGKGRNLHEYPIDFLNSLDLIIVETSFYDTWHSPLVTIRKQLKTKVLSFVGATDRFIRFIRPHHYTRIFKGLEVVDYIGVLHTEDIQIYNLFAPQAKVFHLPVYFELEKEMRNFPDVPMIPNKVLLSVHTSLMTNQDARRGDILSIMIYKRLKEKYPLLSGTTFYHDGEDADFSKLKSIQNFILNTNVRDLTVSPQTSAWKNFLRSAFCSIDISLSRVMGRWNLHHALGGTPIIGSLDIESQRILFPSLSVKWWNAEEAMKRFDWLREDPYARDYVINYARKELPFYSYEKALERVDFIKEEINV